MKPSHYLVRTSLLVALLAGVAAVLAATVVAGPPGSFTAPEVRISPPVVNFGSVTPGETKTRMVSFTNLSDHVIRFASYGIDQPPPYLLFQWRIGDTWPPCPVLVGAERAELLPGDTCTVPLYVQAPSDEAGGTYGATFRIDWWDNLTQRLLLTVPLSVKVR